MTPPALRMCFGDRAALERELETNLKLGRAFVHDAPAIEVLADCTLVLVHPDDNVELMLTGQAVFVSDAGGMSGVGVQLRPFDADVASALEAFVRGERAADAAGDAGALAPDSDADADADAAVTPSDAAVSAETAGDAAHAESPAQAPASDASSDPDAESDADTDTDTDTDDDHEALPPADLQKQQARHERLRTLNQTQQNKMARSGDLQDRVMLERLFGKGVWDSLLHNPKLTLPEVARMARKGTMPRPLLEQIVDNNTWIQAPIVRRALLGNPRMSSEGIMKLLRITPRHELKVIHKTTTYSTQVREAARKVLDL